LTSQNHRPNKTKTKKNRLEVTNDNGTRKRKKKKSKIMISSQAVRPSDNKGQATTMSTVATTTTMKLVGMMMMILVSSWCDRAAATAAVVPLSEVDALGDGVFFGDVFKEEGVDVGQRERTLQQQVPPPYHVQTNFGKRFNYDVTSGNPMRGLASNNPENSRLSSTGVATSLAHLYYRFDLIVKDRNVYDWTHFESMLNLCRDRHGAHAIPRIYIHYPRQPLALPKYLLDIVPLFKYTVLDAA
jgi:hypothetical protein